MDTEEITKVVNVRNESCDKYGGRGSILGNPYVIGRDGTREEVIERYREWFYFLLRDADFISLLKTYKGKKLGCFCSPLPCHLEVVKAWLDEN